MRKKSEDLSTGEWLAILLILPLINLIPFLGWIGYVGLHAVWAFTDNYKESVLRNYAQAVLIIMAISTVFVVLFFGSIYTAYLTYLSTL